MQPIGNRSPRTVIFTNLSQPPFNNNLLPPVEAFRKVGSVHVVEPHLVPGFVPTGAASPAEIPATAALLTAEESVADQVVCLGGALFLSSESRSFFDPTTVFVGIALSDPLGLDASIAIAPEFDLFYTQDPQTIPAYSEAGLDVKRCDLAVDAEIFRPIPGVPTCDVVFIGKWTPYRDHMLCLLADRFTVNIHAHRGEDRWSLPTLSEVDNPDDLCRAFSSAKLAIDFALVEQPGNPFDGTYRITPRTQLAAACGVPTLIEAFPGLDEFFTPGSEIMTFRNAEEMISTAEHLLTDADRRQALGTAARRRVLADHTWDGRVRQILRDVEEVRQRNL
jgi:hypothetical protein